MQQLSFSKLAAYANSLSLDNIYKPVSKVFPAPTKVFIPDLFKFTDYYCNFLARVTYRSFANSLAFVKERPPSKLDLITDLWVTDKGCRFVKAFYDGGANVCAVGPRWPANFQSVFIKYVPLGWIHQTEQHGLRKYCV